MTGGGIRDILLLISESAAVRALGADININSNPIEGIIGENVLDTHNLIKSFLDPTRFRLWGFLLLTSIMDK